MRCCVLLAALHLAACVGSAQRPGDQQPSGRCAGRRPKLWQAAREAFRQAPFLVNLAVLVLLGTVSAALLDYLFKSGAAAAYGKGPQLTRYFALFYTGEPGADLRGADLPDADRAAPARPGPHHAVAFQLPWHSAPARRWSCRPFVMAPVARALELVFRGSFLRSSYELFFTPVPPREKRATKTFIDVSCDRMGDALGAGVLQLLLLLGPRQAVAPILLVTAALAVDQLLDHQAHGRRLLASVLEHGLLSRAVALNEADVAGLHHAGRAAARHRRVPAEAAPPQRCAPSRPPTVGALTTRCSRALADLRSGCPAARPRRPRARISLRSGRRAARHPAARLG